MGWEVQLGLGEVVLLDLLDKRSSTAPANVPVPPIKSRGTASRDRPSWLHHHGEITKKNNRLEQRDGSALHKQRLPKKEQRRTQGPKCQRWALPPVVIFSLLFLTVGIHCSLHCEEFQADMTKGTKQLKKRDVPCSIRETRCLEAKNGQTGKRFNH